MSVKLPKSKLASNFLVTPNAKCRLRLLRLERTKDYLLMEEEFIKNQERLKPQDENKEKERQKVDEIRGTPMM
jgi:26S proteasome regulatory subunit T2